MAESTCESTLVCPYCSTSHEDDLDSLGDFDEFFKCNNCGDTFMARAERSIDYIGTAIEA
jgi:predicted Zn finger-like uncharacterized protein